MKLIAKSLLLALPLLSTAALQGAPAAENWDNLCAKCHGPDGKGQTKVGRKLQIKDYTDPAVQAALTDDEMARAIADGVKDKGGKEAMKAFKEELAEPEIRELVAYVRKFKA